MEGPFLTALSIEHRHGILSTGIERDNCIISIHAKVLWKVPFLIAGHIIILYAYNIYLLVSYNFPECVVCLGAG